MLHAKIRKKLWEKRGHYFEVLHATGLWCSTVACYKKCNIYRGEEMRMISNNGPRKIRNGRKGLILALNVPKKLACPES